MITDRLPSRRRLGKLGLRMPSRETVLALGAVAAAVDECRKHDEPPCLA